MGLEEEWYMIRFEILKYSSNLSPIENGVAVDPESSMRALLL
jgi:hypothetical protein